MRWTRQRFARDGIAGRVERPVSDQQHADERCCCGRRSRVVLTPRRWCQVRGWQVGPTGRGQNLNPLTTVAKEPGHRGEPDISRKTIACGNAGRFRCTRCYSCAFYHYNCTRGRGCNGHPAFPTPSMGAEDKCTTRAFCAAGFKRTPRDRHCERSEAIHSSLPFFARRDGLLRSARNDGPGARIRATRSLAMTVWLFEIESNNKHARRPGLEPGPITTGRDVTRSWSGGPFKMSSGGYGSRLKAGTTGRESLFRRLDPMRGSL